jgi:Holliday junction resolvase-like predicted endonuclease
MSQPAGCTPPRPEKLGEAGEPGTPLSDMKENIMMEVEKSSRHSKITGDFSEGLILYWLSKYGFECAIVDHVGIDIIARNSRTKELMGISVKSRSRNNGKEGQYVHIPNDHFDKVQEACKAFDCVPYMAVVVDKDMIYTHSSRQWSTFYRCFRGATPQLVGK